MNNDSSSKIYSIFSDFRYMFMIWDYLNGRLNREQLEILKEFFTEEELVYLLKIQNWLLYNIYDILHYFYKTSQKTIPEWVTRNRMYYYPKAMSEQVEILDWDNWIFQLKSNDCKILDIGCGLSPYKSLFAETNKNTNFTYIGVDKRSYVEYDNKADSFIKSNVSCDNINNLLLSIKPNMVFFGNSIHCFEKPLELLHIIIYNKFVEEIVIIEYTDSVINGKTFPYHLSIHTNTKFLSCDDLYLFFKGKGHYIDLTWRKASQQHYGIKFCLRR